MAVFLFFFVFLGAGSLLFNGESEFADPLPKLVIFSVGVGAKVSAVYTELIVLNKSFIHVNADNIRHKHIVCT